MMVQATRCPDCSSYVSRDIYFGRFGKRNNVPLWVCPNCGVVHEDYRWFKYVSQQEASAIIEHRGPRGLFVLETGVEYIGIDNSTGDAWTEEFPDLTECMMWLVGEKEAAQEAKAQRKYETGGGPAEDVELRQYRCLRCNHVWYEDCDAPDYPDYCPGCGESLCRGGTQESQRQNYVRNCSAEPSWTTCSRSETVRIVKSSRLLDLNRATTSSTFPTSP